MSNMSRLALTLCMTLVVFLSTFQVVHAFEKEVNNISATMAENISNAGRQKIAVVDFTDLQGNVTEFGRFLAEEFSVALAGAGKGFDVVDRTHLKSILTEHKLASKGLIDPATARKLGKIAGVEALITGTITPFGDTVRLSVKILDTETAKVIGATRGNIAKTQAIEELLSRGVEGGLQSSSSGYIPSSGSSNVFQNKFVRASVIRIAKVPKRKKLTVSLRIENKANEDLKLQLLTGHINGYLRPYTKALSEKGESCAPGVDDINGGVCW